MTLQFHTLCTHSEHIQGMSSTVHLLVHHLVSNILEWIVMKFDIGDLYKSCYEVNSGLCLNTFMFPLHETEEFYHSSKKLHIIQNIVLE